MILLGLTTGHIKRTYIWNSYLCDGVTHNPITILDGRDGTELKKKMVGKITSI